MNPNNKITNPLPTKTAPNKNPYDRIQSAPPEGKEEDKKKDIQIKEAFKMNQAKKMNLNSTSFQHKLPPLFQNQEEAQKKPKPFNNLNLNSSEFKNLEDKEKINSVFIDPTQQKQTLSFTLPSQEKMNDTKKKLSLKSSSKPFTMNFGDIHQESPTNKTNAKEVDSPQTKPQIQIQPQTVILDPKPIEHQPLGILNFSQMNSSSYPKLSNKKNPKITVSATNSSNNLVEKLQKSDLNLEILQKNNDISQKEQETVEETSEKGLPPILEESHVKEDVQQGDSQLFRNYAIKEIPSSTSSQKKNDLNFKEISSATQMRKVEGLSKSPEKTNEKAIQRQVEQEVKLEINAKKEENKLESPTNGPIPLIQSKVELTPETCYKEFMLSIIEIGKKTRLNNPPIDIIPYIRREVYVESTAFKKTYNKNQGHSNNRIKIENVHLEKDDFTIERNTTIIQNNNTGHPINDLNDSLFFREPENQKKLDIKKQLHKWTKHFKEIGKNENIKMKNAMRLNLNILTPDNFQKLKPVFVDLVKNSPENLKLLADKIIEKAWNEPKYITTYASLCSYLQDEKSLQAPSDKLTEDGKKGKNKKLFKGFLLGRIQQAFEKQDFLKTNDGDAEDDISRTKVETLKKIKKQVFGNVTFIGQLYICKVIPCKVINICVLYMLSKFLEDYSKHFSQKSTSEYPVFEDDLEAILILFDQVGKTYEKERLEKEKKEKKEQNNNPTDEKQFLEQIKKIIIAAEHKTPSEDDIFFIKSDSNDLTVHAIFDLLKFFQEDLPELSSRMKLLIENLTERRNDDWKDKLFSNEGPKKIADLHEEIKKEQEEIYKSAMEYKEKYPYDNYSRQTPQRVYQQRPVAKFQVAIEKNPREEEKREIQEIPQNPQNKVKLNFSVNRDVASKTIEKEQKYNLEEVKVKVKEIFAKLTNENNEKIISENFSKLSQKCPPHMLLLAFFEEYSNDKIPEVDKRLEIPYKMIKENILPKEDFLKEFNEFLSRSWEIASDIPYLVISLAKIFILFVKNNICKFHDLEIFSSSANEDYEDVICFIKEFIEAAFKLLKEKNLEKEYECDLFEFFKKINLHDDIWFEKMKGRC